MKYSLGKIVIVTESIPPKIYFLPIFSEVHSVGMGDQITASKLRLQWDMLFMLIFYMAMFLSSLQFIIFWVKHLFYTKLIENVNIKSDWDIQTQIWMCRGMEEIQICCWVITFVKNRNIFLKEGTRHLC